MENDDEEINKLLEETDRQIADLTEACEPIVTWDGTLCLVVRVYYFELAVDGDSSSDLLPCFVQEFVD